MASRAKARQYELQRLLDFTPCPTCTLDIVTGEGQRACHYYVCPYLPEELDVSCPRCSYNFITDETRPACGEPPSCDFALYEAPQRVENLGLWLEHHRSGQAPPS